MRKKSNLYGTFRKVLPAPACAGDPFQELPSDSKVILSAEGSVQLRSLLSQSSPSSLPFAAL